MIITYYFGEYDDDEEFEFEADPYEYVDSLEKPVQWKIAKEMFDNFDDLTKEDAKRAFSDCINDKFDIVKQDDELLYSILHEYGTEEDVYNVAEEGVDNFFEAEAVEEYNDEKEYRKDPMWYYGLKQSDFL